MIVLNKLGIDLSAWTSLVVEVSISVSVRGARVQRSVVEAKKSLADDEPAKAHDHFRNRPLATIPKTFGAIFAVITGIEIYLICEVNAFLMAVQ